MDVTLLWECGGNGLQVPVNVAVNGSFRVAPSRFTEIVFSFDVVKQF